MATGSSRAGYRMMQQLGHNVQAPLPSLFSFIIKDPALNALTGLSSRFAKISLRAAANLTTNQLKNLTAGSSISPEEFRNSFTQRGPLLITQYGISGPAALKLSAFGAKVMAAMNYSFEVQINWAGEMKEDDLVNLFLEERDKHSNRNIGKCFPRLPLEMIDALTGEYDYALDDEEFTKSTGTSALSGSSAEEDSDDRNDVRDASLYVSVMSRRLWLYLLDRALIDQTRKWSTIKTPMLQRLAKEICQSTFVVAGRGSYKDEFVTCGGVPLREVNMNTMESKKVSGLYFCGEILDIDGITGGYNFQSAWTTGYIAGTSCADSLLQSQSQ